MVRLQREKKSDQNHQKLNFAANIKCATKQRYFYLIKIVILQIFCECCSISELKRWYSKSNVENYVKSFPIFEKFMNFIFIIYKNSYLTNFSYEKERYSFQ